MDIDYGLVAIIVLFLLFVVGVITYHLKKEKNDIVGLHVVEKDVDHDHRFFLHARRSNGTTYVMNKDKPLTFNEMEVYLESEMNKLCTK